MEKTFLIALHAAEHAKGQQQAQRVDEVASSGGLVERPKKSGLGEARIGGKGVGDRLGKPS